MAIVDKINKLIAKYGGTPTGPAGTIEEKLDELEKVVDAGGGGGDGTVFYVHEMIQGDEVTYPAFWEDPADIAAAYQAGKTCIFLPRSSDSRPLPAVEMMVAVTDSDNYSIYAESQARKFITYGWAKLDIYQSATVAYSCYDGEGEYDMDYTKFEDETISAPESPIEIVTYTYDGGAERWTCDKSYSDLTQSLNSGKILLAKTYNEDWPSNASYAPIVNRDSTHIVFSYCEVNTSRSEVIEYYIEHNDDNSMSVMATHVYPTN